MYKMYDNQLDEDSDEEDKASVNSSSGEEVEVERMLRDDGDTKHTETLEKTREQHVEFGVTVEQAGQVGGRDLAKPSEREGNDLEGCGTGVESPALSLLTSGYGTYQPDSSSKGGPEEGDFRDDGTIAEFDRDNSTIVDFDRDNSTIVDFDRDDGSIAGFDIDDGTIAEFDRDDGTIVDFEKDNGTIAEFDIDNATIAESDEYDYTIAEFYRESQEDVLEVGYGEQTHYSSTNVDRDGKEPSDGTNYVDSLDTHKATEVEDSGCTDVVYSKDNGQRDALDSKEYTDSTSGEVFGQITPTKDDEPQLDVEYTEDDSPELVFVEEPVAPPKEEKIAEPEWEHQDTEESSTTTTDRIKYIDSKQSSTSSSSTDRIKYIDSKEISTTMRAFSEWEANIRRRMSALSELEERLGWTDASILAQDRSRSFRDQDSDLESEDAASLDDRHSSEGDAFEAFMQRLDRNENDPRPRPKSFIRPVLDHPHTRNLKKTDPVTKYFEYKQHWEAFKSRGEKDRKNLQWEIREQLQYQPPPPRPRRAYVPNTYVVPTDKKRSALRWEVRHDLARGLLPANNYRTFGAPR